MQRYGVSETPDSVMAATLRIPSQRWQQQSSQQAYTLVRQDDAASSSLSMSSPHATQLDRLYRKITWRLLPLFMLVLGLNYLDRTSLAFASIQMTQDLNFSPEVYGFASGLFFLTYCMMQVPANFICMYLGVQKWFSGMMLVWGFTAAAFAAVRTPWQFYSLRLLLGVAEAGSFPGVWYAITLWFPPDRIAVPYSLVGAAVAISQMLAAPLAAGLLRLDGMLRLSGWQWVFLGEALPSVVLALCLPMMLPDSPESVVKQGFGNMLSAHELELLRTDRMRKTQHPVTDMCSRDLSNMESTPALAVPPLLSPLKLLLHVAGVWQVWYLAVCNIFKDIANLALMMWLPVMVHALMSGGDPLQMATEQAIVPSTSSSSSHTGTPKSTPSADTGVKAVLLSAIPFSVAAIAVWLSGVAAQKTGRPLIFIIVPNLIGGISFISFHQVVQWRRLAGFTCLIITLSCAYVASPHAPTIIARLTAGPAAAIAMPCFNSVAMLGGFIGPSIMGFLVQRLGGFTVASTIMGGSMIISGSMAMILQCIMLSDKEQTVRGFHDEQHGLKIDQNTAAANAAADGYELVYRNTNVKAATGDQMAPLGV